MLPKDTLITIKVLISKALIDSYITYGEFFSASNVLREYDDMREAIIILRSQWFIENFKSYIKQCYHIVCSVENILKVKT